MSRHLLVDQGEVAALVEQGLIVDAVIVLGRGAKTYRIELTVQGSIDSAALCTRRAPAKAREFVRLDAAVRWVMANVPSPDPVKIRRWNGRGRKQA